jgi:hypothetical protein
VIAHASLTAKPLSASLIPRADPRSGAGRGRRQPWSRSKPAGCPPSLASPGGATSVPARAATPLRARQIANPPHARGDRSLAAHRSAASTAARTTRRSSTQLRRCRGDPHPGQPSWLVGRRAALILSTARRPSRLTADGTVRIELSPEPPQAETP